MIIKEFDEMLKMQYYELCIYLQKKYGLAKYAYFKFRENGYNYVDLRNIKDGLIIHHMYEYGCNDLSDKHKPYRKWEQEPKALVYCNYLEHILLHSKIPTKNIPKILISDVIWCFTNITILKSNKGVDTFKGRKELREEVLKEDGRKILHTRLLPLIKDDYNFIALRKNIEWALKKSTL